MLNQKILILGKLCQKLQREGQRVPRESPTWSWRPTVSMFVGMLETRNFRKLPKYFFFVLWSLCLKTFHRKILQKTLKFQPFKHALCHRQKRVKKFCLFLTKLWGFKNSNLYHKSTIFFCLKFYIASNCSEIPKNMFLSKVSVYVGTIFSKLTNFKNSKKKH